MIIGLAGSKGAGKSTVAKYLRDQKKFTMLPFAAPLKAMLMTMGLTYEQVYGNEKEIADDLLCGKTPRWAMQSLGTEWGRKLIGPDLWVRAWENIVIRELAAKVPPNIVCDDVRFPNEVEAIRALGGKIVKIRRPGVEGAINHESELYAMTLKADFEIHNPEDEQQLAINSIALYVETLGIA